MQSPDQYALAKQEGVLGWHALIVVLEGAAM
jgi:hypothetical protein